MPARKHKPIHPGEILLNDFMAPLGLTAYRVAKETGISAQHVGRIIHGERGIGGDAALRLARYLNTTPDFWMNLQARYDLEQARDKAGDDIARTVRPHEAA